MDVHVGKKSLEFVCACDESTSDIHVFDYGHVRACRTGDPSEHQFSDLLLHTDYPKST